MTTQEPEAQPPITPAPLAAEDPYATFEIPLATPGGPCAPVSPLSPLSPLGPVAPVALLFLLHFGAL